MTSSRLARPSAASTRTYFPITSLKPLAYPFHRKRETIRRQRIESEQRRRDDLREGFARLKDVLPVSNQKGSKMALLDRGKHSIHLPTSLAAHPLFG